MNITRILICPVVTVPRIGVAKEMKINSCHENLDNVVITSSFQKILTKVFLIYSVLIIECLNHPFFKDENLRLDAILGAMYDQTFLMQGYFCLQITKELQ